MNKMTRNRMLMPLPAMGTLLAGDAPAQSALAAQAAALPSMWPTLFALAMVIAAIVIFGWLMKKLRPGTTKSGQLLRTISQLPLGQKERIVVVAFQSQWLVVGVTAQSIQLLSTHSAPPADNPYTDAPRTRDNGAAFSATPFGHWLDRALRRQPAAGKNAAPPTGHNP